MRHIPPHIIVILADDLGYHDIGFNGNPRITSPRVNALAATGAILRHHYAFRFCSPSRASFLSGRLPLHVSESNPDTIDSPGGADLRMTLLPQKLRLAGYYTALLGKWHVGARQSVNLPSRRGFDHFFGILSGSADHYSSRAWEADCKSRTLRPRAEDAHEACARHALGCLPCGTMRGCSVQW